MGSHSRHIIYCYLRILEPLTFANHQIVHSEYASRSLLTIIQLNNLKIYPTSMLEDCLWNPYETPFRIIIHKNRKHNS